MFRAVRLQVVLPIICLFFLPLVLSAKDTRQTPQIVDWIYTYRQRNGLKIGHFVSDIYIKFRMENDRHNVAMRIIPFVGKQERGKKSYLGESFVRMAYTAPGILDKKEIAFYSTMPYMRNIRDVAMASMELSIYDPTLLKDRILSPLNYRNRNYYKYELDTLVQFEGRTLRRVRFRPRVYNMQLVEGYLDVVPLTGEVRLFCFRFCYNMENISGTITLGDEGLAKLLPKDIFLQFGYKFLKNSSLSSLSAHCDYHNLLQYNKKDVQRVFRTNGQDLTFLKRLSVDSAQTNNSLQYFEANRPFTLSSADDSVYAAYQRRHISMDSLGRLHRDSLAKGLAKEKVMFSDRVEDALLGSHYISLGPADLLRLPPIITPSMFEWSNRKGLSLKTKIRFSSDFKKGHNLTANLYLGYNFRNNEFFFKTPTYWTFAPRHNGQFQIEFGKGNPLYNSQQADDIRKHLSSNMQYDSLLNVFNRYHFNYYKDYYGKVAFAYEILNGLNVRLQAVYHDRRLQEWNKVADQNGMDREYRSFAQNLRVEWTPGLFYYINRNQKRPLFSHWPTFIAEWERGIHAFGCDNRYERWEFETNYRINLYALRSITLKAGGGFYSTRHQSYFVDYENFRYNSLPDSWLDVMMGQFEALDQNWYNESPYYIRLCGSYESPMLLFSRIKIFTKYIKRERIYCNLLNVHALYPYTEAGYSVSTHLFDFGGFVGATRKGNLSFGWKLVLRFLEDN